MHFALGDVSDRYFTIPFEQVQSEIHLCFPVLVYFNYSAAVFCTFYFRQVVVASCPGTAFDREPTAWGPGPLFVSCQGGQDLAVWTAATADTPTALQWDDLSCQKQPLETVRVLGACGRDGKATEIEIGFVADDGGTLDNMSDDIVVTSITVCHDEARSQTLWARHTLWNEVAAGDHGNDSPPFKPDTFFDYDVNTFYTMNKQRETIAGLVGSQVDGYIFLCCTFFYQRFALFT